MATFHCIPFFDFCCRGGALFPLSFNARKINGLCTFYVLLANGAAQEKFDQLTSPIWTFYVTQSFLSRDPFGEPRGPGVGLAWSCLC